MSARAWITALLLGAAALALPAAAQKAQPAAPAAITIAELPQEARATLALIRRGGPFPYAKDGVAFGNREGRLPIQKRGYYREYTVKTPGERTRGARRIIAGRGGEYFYTDDHYNHFRQIRE
ncbi:MAG: ribonuclease domain-containing protein [Usitatibacter sp.]